MSEYPVLECGDIFMTDSDKTGPKIVKFFQTAPTVWQYLWRKIRGTNEKVEFYHVGMVGFNNIAFEQQTKFQKADSLEKAIFRRRHIVFRKKGLTEDNKQMLYTLATENLGYGYDILHIIGKTLTWLTGIPLFARFLEWPNAEICINRVGQLFQKADVSRFGLSDYRLNTTHIMYKYCMSHPEEFEIISYRKEM